MILSSQIRKYVVHFLRYPTINDPRKVTDNFRGFFLCVNTHKLIYQIVVIVVKIENRIAFGRILSFYFLFIEYDIFVTFSI